MTKIELLSDFGFFNNKKIKAGFIVLLFEQNNKSLANARLYVCYSYWWR